MPNSHKADLKNLEKRVKALSSALLYISKVAELKELLIIIKRPGWTTPAEFIFASGIVDSMLGHTIVLTKLKNQLLKGSKSVNLKQ